MAALPRAAAGFMASSGSTTSISFPASRTVVISALRVVGFNGGRRPGSDEAEALSPGTGADLVPQHAQVAPRGFTFWPSAANTSGCAASADRMARFAAAVSAAASTRGSPATRR